MEYEATIGLEIHAELKTKTKMFCDCLNNSEEKTPNKNVCPVCLGHPGTLPVINLQAVENVIKVGLALGSQITEFSKFDRKNYFYPDLPKGYQISQYDKPLCQGGKLKLFLSDNEEESKKEIQITRIHLEEDTGKLIHPADGKSTLIDFNRAGVPLMELVTEPVIHSGREARWFAQGLQILLKNLGVSSADMEKGQMRCEVNISLRPKGEAKLGTKVEVKNLNSFKAVERAIDYEIKRQSEILEKGEKIVQETRGWDPLKEITYSQRIKEEAQDYRYFPEPDLPPLHLYSQTKEGGLFNLEELKKNLPELPWEKKYRLIRTYQIPFAGANIIIQDEKLLTFFEEAVRFLSQKSVSDLSKGVLLIYNYLITDILGLKEKNNLSWNDIKLTPENFANLINYLLNNKITSRVTKNILEEIITTNESADELIQERGLEQVSESSSLLPIIEKVINSNDKAVADYKKGKETAIQFLVGQCMAQLKGAGNPQELEKLIREKMSR
ncbi:MAG: Asp-tRNA(Asn)/Glu-tRNA(Gln) amidotransferase subunit GatB [Parcubacteria group bacterium]|nr:Asp-tRNA(Asn)/Glu-tRNA(Gln) amidotransferase subunit GatB [Parcubacteria group bacterium]